MPFIAGFKDMRLFTKIISICSIYGFIPFMLCDGDIQNVILAIQISSTFMMFYLNKTGQYWKDDH